MDINRTRTKLDIACEQALHLDPRYQESQAQHVEG